MMKSTRMQKNAKQGNVSVLLSALPRLMSETVAGEAGAARFAEVPALCELEP